MNLLRGFGVGLVLAGIGAAAWAGLSIVTEWRIGLLAIVVGALAGLGMTMGSQKRGGVAAGLLAMTAALIAIVASRAVVANVMASRVVHEHGVSTEEAAIERVAEEMYEDWTEEERVLTETENGYPVGLIAAAQKRWDRFGEDERQIRLLEAERELESGRSVATGALTLVALLVDFGLFGFVFVGMGMATAYKTGSQSEKQESAGFVDGEQVVKAEEPRPFIPMTAGDDEDPLEKVRRLRERAQADAASSEQRAA